MFDYDPRLAETAFNEGRETRRRKRLPASLPYFPDSDEARAWHGSWHESDAPDQPGILSRGPGSPRKPGFHWVHEGGETLPEPAYWDGMGWAMIGLETPLGGRVVLSELPIVFQA